MNRFWILDCGFWIEEANSDASNANPKSQIQNPKCLPADSDLRLAAAAAAALFAGLFVVGDALDVLGEAFLLARLLEPPQHLLRGLVAAALDLDHCSDPFSRTLSVTCFCVRSADGFCRVGGKRLV